MSAIMIFVTVSAAMTICAGFGWWTYALFTKSLPKRERKVTIGKIVKQPWDDKAGARGIR